MIAQLVALLTPLEPVVLEAIKAILDALISKKDPSAAIRHAEAQASRALLGLPLKGI